MYLARNGEVDNDKSSITPRKLIWNSARAQVAGLLHALDKLYGTMTCSSGDGSGDPIGGARSKNVTTRAIDSVLKRVADSSMRMRVLSIIWRLSICDKMVPVRSGGKRCGQDRQNWAARVFTAVRARI